MKSIYKKILSIGLVGALLELVPIRFANASLVDFAAGTVTMAAQVILGIMMFVAQGFFIVTGFFIELAMKLNNNILDPEQNKFVFSGWTVFVNVADLALVVALIIIAFATMLNFQSYGMKKTLVPLILVALLVNFSLVIPGVLIDLSGMVTSFFVNQAGLTGTNMSSALASAFNISGFMNTAGMLSSDKADALKGVTAGKLGAGIMSVLLNMVFIIVFTAVATVIMLTLAAMLFIRYFMLSFLLLMSPLIAVSRIFPSTKSHWDKWWNDFVRWTMFPPVMVFFMWLALTSLNATNSIAHVSTGSAEDAAKKLMNFDISSLISMAMAIMLMILSLVAANGISIKGAKGSKDMVASMTGWGRGKIEGWGKGARATGASAAAYARREAARTGRRAGAGAIAGAGLAGAAIEKKIGRPFTAEGLRKYEAEKGGLRGYAAGKLGRVGERISTAQQASLKKAYEDKFKGMSEDNLAMRYSTMGADEKVFAAQQLAAKGKLSKVNEQMLDRDLSDKNAKATFDKYGGEKTYDKVAKAAGRNAEMIEAKGKEDENSAKIREIENKIDSAMREPNSPDRNTRVRKLGEEKAELKKGNYDEVAKKFYDSFGRKDFESLGSNFYDKGKYGDAALKSLLIKEPNAFSKIVSGLDKSGDAQQFNDKAIKIIESMKKEALEVIKKAPNAPIELETNKELLSVMKGMKDFNEENAKDMNVQQKMKWIEEKDARVHAALGGEKLATSLEQQMKFLIETRKNPAIMGLEGAQDYQKAIRTQETMRKSMGNRIYAESEKKEEEKKPA